MQKDGREKSLNVDSRYLTELLLHFQNLINSLEFFNNLKINKF